MDPPPGDGLPYTRADVDAAQAHLRELCAELPEVTERVSHSSVTFFVRGKRVVAYVTDDHHGDGRLALIVPAPPGVQDELLRSEPDRFFRPPYVGHRGWIGLRLDVDRDGEEVRRILHDAYRQVAPAPLVRQLDAAGGR
jgi:hypothetical protein